MADDHTGAARLGRVRGARDSRFALRNLRLHRRKALAAVYIALAMVEVGWIVVGLADGDGDSAAGEITNPPRTARDWLVTDIGGDARQQSERAGDGESSALPPTTSLDGLGSSTTAEEHAIPDRRVARGEDLGDTAARPVGAVRPPGSSSAVTDPPSAPGGTPPTGNTTPTVSTTASTPTTRPVAPAPSTTPTPSTSSPTTPPPSTRPPTTTPVATSPATTAPATTAPPTRTTVAALVVPLPVEPVSVCTGPLNLGCVIVGGG
jgi:hypothetical protein